VEWLIRLYARHMTKKSHGPGRIPLDRIYSRILTDDLLFGTHLMVEARYPERSEATSNRS
jgi:hypothetical protein